MDPIANLITMIRNGYAIKKTGIIISHSKPKERILSVLKDEGYIKNFKVISKDNKKKEIKISLKYLKGRPTINKIKQISFQGKRVYLRPSNFEPVLPLAKQGRDLGVTVMSTSKGVMTTKEAKKKNVGGEVIMKVY